MRRRDETEVLVVGAGPVGMYTALRLAKSGIDVQLIDQEPCTAGRSYACALHPRTLQLLDEAGVARDAIKLGHRIETVAFYEGAYRRAEFRLDQLPVEFPFVLVLEQNRLEDLLEQKLKQQAGLHVRWNHRLTDLVVEESGITANIDELALDGKGYVVPEFGVAVKRALSERADFVVGADGQASVVRQRLDIGYERTAERELFAIYEFETGAKLPPEMRIVLEDHTASVLWPFGGNKCRWSFQWFQPGVPTDFPQKDRIRCTIAEPPGPGDSRHHLQQSLAARAPWFEGEIRDIGWCVDIQFKHRLARQFGRERAWLAGDAAHQTGPIGTQSMNVGFREAAELATNLTRILREKGSLDLLETYNRERRAEWEQLLGWKGCPKASTTTDEWVRERSRRLVSCLPASGPELTLLLHQSGLEFEYAGLQEAAA
jgi:2-polyprenyl-6-methoxyphenol hydroxylase-like FAD-dependent oxidoreductase